MAKQSSSNIYLFYGEDDFSLRRKVERWKAEFAKKYTASSVYLIDGAGIEERAIIQRLEEMLSPSLFSSKKLVIARDVLPTKAAQSELAEFFLKIAVSLPADCFLVLWQTTRPDKRLAFTKKFLPLTNVSEFNLPHGPQLTQWIKLMAGEFKVGITDRAADKLAIYLGRDLVEEKKIAGKVIDRKEAFNLWEVYSELAKLACFTANIQEADIERLVEAKVPENVFRLTDEIIGRNKAGAFKVLEDLLRKESTDEKSAIIKIVGLLAEQIRSFILVSSLLAENLDNEQIAARLGWTSGRVFITARNLRNIQVLQLPELLDRLLGIDLKLKSADENPKLLIDQFVLEAVG